MGVAGPRVHSRLLFTKRQWHCKPGTLTIKGITLDVSGVASHPDDLSRVPPSLTLPFLRAGNLARNWNISQPRREPREDLLDI